MHIVHIAPYYPPYLGGQERFVASLSRHLVRMRHTVTVLTSRYPRQMPAESVDEGVRVFRSPCLMRPLRNPISPGLLLPPTLLNSADILHAHNEHSFAALAAVILSRRWGKPLLLTVHGRLVMESRLANTAVQCYESTLSRMIFRAADGITVVAPAERRRLLRRYHIRKPQMKVVPVGIDIGYWDGLQKEPTIAYAWRDAVRGKRTIFVAAQLIRRKGIDYLIRAMPEILTVQPKSVLLIAGDGSEEIVLRRLAHLLRLDGSVYFLGRVADGELSALYGTADVVVLSSLSEGLPTCLLEALVHKKPVVATRIDGAKDYFSDVVELVEPADSAALAGGVLDVLGNMRAAADKAAAGRRLVEKAFHWPVLAEQMVSAYRTAIAAAGERLQ